MFEKLKIYGDQEQGYSGHIEEGGVTGVEAGLKKCGFCKGMNQRIVNTHSPHYWIECACGAQMHAEHFDEKGYWPDKEYDDPLLSEVSCRLAHEDALRHIINKWNNRP